jgi:hypothetical protein
MKTLDTVMMCVVILFGIGLTASLAMADEDKRLSVPVAFGRGLNTTQQGNTVNRVILPDEIKLDQGGLCNFLWPDSTRSSCISLAQNLTILSSALPARLSTIQPTNFTMGSIRQGGRGIRRLPG